MSVCCRNSQYSHCCAPTSLCAAWQLNVWLDNEKLSLSVNVPTEAKHMRTALCIRSTFSTWSATVCDSISYFHLSKFFTSKSSPSIFIRLASHQGDLVHEWLGCIPQFWPLAVWIIYYPTVSPCEAKKSKNKLLIDLVLIQQVVQTERGNA